MKIATKMMDEETMLVQLNSFKEVEEIMANADDPSSPFVGLERWLEVRGSPPRPRRVRISRVPLQAWLERIFRLLGNCLGHTIEVDPKTSSKEVISHGRVKVLLRRVHKFPAQIPLLAGDLQILATAEVETNSNDGLFKNIQHRSSDKEFPKARNCHGGREVEDDDISPVFLKSRLQLEVG